MGAAWNYVFWGLLHCVYEVAGGCDGAAWRSGSIKSLHTRTESFSYRMLRTVKCWLLVCFAYIFSKYLRRQTACGYLWRMATKWNPRTLFDGSLFTLGISEKYAHVLWIAIARCCC